MPRTKLGDKYSPKAPPLDDAWGRVLCRMQQLDMDKKTMAELTGFHYDTIRHTMTQPPGDWPPNIRDAILRVLGLRAELVIKDANE